MISFIRYGSEKTVYKFPSGNKLADARKEVTSYMGAQQLFNQKFNLFEDDAEIRLLSFLMQSICKQPEHTFIKMAWLHSKLISTLKFLTN